VKKKRYKRRKNLTGKMPVNLYYWLCTIKKEEELNQFLLRGDARQKGCIIDVLSYIKTYEPDEFKAVGGSIWLKKFKEAFNETESF